MELNFKSLEEYIQAYMDGPIVYEIKEDKKIYLSKSMESDLERVSPAQRLGFIEKYMEFIAAKQLRRGTSTASDDKDFRLVEH